MHYKSGSFYCTCPENSLVQNIRRNSPIKLGSEANFCQACGTRLKDTCSMCHGRGNTICTNCGGLILGGCQACNGTGSVTKLHICSGATSRQGVRPTWLNDEVFPNRGTIRNSLIPPSDLKPSDRNSDGGGCGTVASLVAGLFILLLLFG